jgi:anti-sigma B factor antagonist
VHLDHGRVSLRETSVGGRSHCLSLSVASERVDGRAAIEPVMAGFDVEGAGTGSVAGSPAQAVARFEVRVQPAREVVRIKPVGELDLASVGELRDQVRELLAVGFERLIIDLRGLSFVDVCGLGLLLCLADQARGEGWRLSLIPPNEHVGRIFELTGTAAQLPFHSPIRTFT